MEIKDQSNSNKMAELELKQLAEIILETEVSEKLLEDLIALTSDRFEEFASYGKSVEGAEWSGGWNSFETFQAVSTILEELLLGRAWDPENDDPQYDFALKVAAESYGKTETQESELFLKGESELSERFSAEKEVASSDEISEIQSILSDQLSVEPSEKYLRDHLLAELYGDGTPPTFLVEARTHGWLDAAVVVAMVEEYCSLALQRDFELDEPKLKEKLEYAEKYWLEYEEFDNDNPSSSWIYSAAHPSVFDGEESVESDLSEVDSKDDDNDDGEWGLIEIDADSVLDTDELHLLQIVDEDEPESGFVEDDRHSGHVHELLDNELRSTGDYSGEPADEKEKTVLALIAEGILRAEISEILFENLIAESDSLIRRARVKGFDYWTSPAAATDVANVLAYVLTGERWPGGDIMAGELDFEYLEDLQVHAEHYPLDPPKSSPDLTAMTIDERFNHLREEFGKPSRALSIGQDDFNKVKEHLRGCFGEEPNEIFIKDILSLYPVTKYYSAEDYGWHKSEVFLEVGRIGVKILTGFDGWPNIDAIPRDEFEKIDLPRLIREYKVNSMTEDEFIANYDQSRWPAVGATVDLSVFTILDGKLQVLLIERGNHPEMGKWALPGGFVDVTESIDDAALRELMEETSVDLSEGGHLEQVKTYGYPGRDRRGYMISTLYTALIADMPEPKAADDAAKARFFPVEEALGEDFELAFDHRILLTDALERVRAKIEYAPVAFSFLPSKFTIEELKNVYEIVWGQNLLTSDFRRHMFSAEDSLSSDVDGNRYSRGTATRFYPPLDRAKLGEAFENFLEDNSI